MAAPTPTAQSSAPTPLATPGKSLRRSRFAFVRRIGHGLATWWDHDGPRLGAAVAYYAIFALAPTLVIAISVAGAVFGADAARGHIVTQLGGLVGETAAQYIEAMIASAWRSDGNGLAALLGIVTLLVASTGVFAELRFALNKMFDVAPHESALGGLVRARVTAVALVLAFGFLLIVSLMISAGLAALGNWLSSRYPEAEVAIAAIDVVTSMIVLTLAFGLILRGLPSKRPSWRASFIAAVASAALFSLGKHLVALYLVRAGIATSFGAAGSFVVVIFWIFYSTQVVLIGAAIGQQFARAAQPAAGAALPGAEAARAHGDPPPRDEPPSATMKNAPV